MLQRKKKPLCHPPGPPGVSIPAAIYARFGFDFLRAHTHSHVVRFGRSLRGGIPFGVGAGLAIGWAFYELRARLKVGVIGALAFGFLLWATLIPMTLFGVIVRATGIHGQDDAWEVVLESVLAFGTGAIAGRLISGRWRAALALGTASLALTFAQAGPIPVMNSGRAASLFAALAAVYLFCVIALGFVASVVSKFLRWPA